MKLRFFSPLIVTLLITTATSCFSQDSAAVVTQKHVNKGFLDFNGYYDTRKFSVMTLNILAKLPHRFQYFSLTNFEGPKQTSDLSNYYSEQNIRWNIKKTIPIDLISQWVLKSDTNNDVLRFGVRWRLNSTTGLSKIFKKLNLSYSVSPYILQFGERTPTKYFAQIEHVYRLKILPKYLGNRIYIAGFGDQNLINNDGKISMKWVSEHQIGVRLFNQFYAVVEYRINDFLPDNNNGLGYGLEYKIKF